MLGKPNGFRSFIPEKYLLKICSGISRLEEKRISEDITEIHSLSTEETSKNLLSLSAKIKPLGLYRQHFRIRFFFYKCKLFFRINYYIISQVLPAFLDRCGRYVTMTALLSVVTGYFIWVGRGDVGSLDTNNLLSLILNSLSYGALISVCVATVAEIGIQLIAKKFYELAIFLIILITLVPFLLICLGIDYFELSQKLYYFVSDFRNPLHWMLLLFFILALVFSYNMLRRLKSKISSWGERSGWLLANLITLLLTIVIISKLLGRNPNILLIISYSIFMIGYCIISILTILEDIHYLKKFQHRKSFIYIKYIFIIFILINLLFSTLLSVEMKSIGNFMNSIESISTVAGTVVIIFFVSSIRLLNHRLLKSNRSVCGQLLTIKYDYFLNRFLILKDAEMEYYDEERGFSS